ncbi:MAG: hypothetical protein M5R36_00960 [Deltaproteobacteria bacterium]|nr:hypothetical protein [Deltaproteobacteria bacterium]
MKVGHKEKGVNRFAGVLALAVLSLLAFIGAAPFASDDLFVVNVRVEKSLMTSLIEAMPDNEKLARLLASACEEVLRFRMDTRSQMAPGDEAALVFKENAKDAPVRLYGVRYKSRLLGRTLRAYYFWEPRREEPEYFDAHGKAFITRLKRSPVTSYKRLGRLYNAKRGQKELEIRAAKHAEVKTPFRARVERINWRPVSGRRIGGTEISRDGYSRGFHAPRHGLGEGASGDGTRTRHGVRSRG